MKALKAAVVIMGLMIIVGVTILVTELVRRATGAGTQETEAPIEVPLNLPPGATVVAMSATSDRVALQVTVPGTDDRIYFVDARTGVAHVASVLNHQKPRPPVAP